MMPGNPVVGGSILRRPAVQSPNYEPGTQGWAINADGTASFADVTITGSSLALDDTAGDPIIQIRSDLEAILIYAGS